MKKMKATYADIVSVDNLLQAWKEFLRGKRKRKDVQEFELHLMDNILNLHDDLRNKTYCHGGYREFRIADPKPRIIHKADVRDRLLHHAIYRILYPYFDKKFIHDSYSCRVGKGTHKAIDGFRYFAGKVSKNNTRSCRVLQCDIKKFFASIDHDILLARIKEYDIDADIVWLIEKVIKSFHGTEIGKGLPLGNLTSQLLVNIYADKLDKYVKHGLRVKYYIRYADDFVFISIDTDELESIRDMVSEFLETELNLVFHPKKIFIKTLSSGIDFLGWVHFPKHRVLRTTTKRKMLKKWADNPILETMQSYKGLMKWGNTHKLQKTLNFI